MVVAAIGPWPIRDEGFRNAEYYQATLRAVSSGPAASGPPGPLRAGFGTAAIPWPRGSRMGWPRQQLFATLPGVGGAEPLQARALALDAGGRTLYLVSADLLLITPALVEATLAALREAGAPADRAWIYFGATHTHSGPGGFGRGLIEQVLLGRYRGSFVRETGKRIAAAVRQAGRSLIPAEIGYGAVPLAAPLGNRLAPGGPVDSTLDILALREVGGGPLATVVAYAAHATTLGGGPRRPSGDYPAALARRLRERTGAPALFFAGAVGSMTVRRDDLRGLEGSERLGELLAGGAASVLPRIAYRGEARLAALRIPVMLPTPQMRLAGAFGLSPVLPSLLLPRQASLHVAAINDVLLVGLPGELSGEQSLPVREEATRRGLHIVPTSVNGEYIGYIVPDARYGTAGYETRWGTAYGPHLGSYFRAVIDEAIPRLAGDAASFAPTSPSSLRSAPTRGGR